MDDEQTGTGLMERLVAEVRTSMVSGASLGDVQDAVIYPAALTVTTRPRSGSTRGASSGRQSGGSVPSPMS